MFTSAGPGVLTDTKWAAQGQKQPGGRRADLGARHFRTQIAPVQRWAQPCPASNSAGPAHTPKISRRFSSSSPDTNRERRCTRTPNFSGITAARRAGRDHQSSAQHLPSEAAACPHLELFEDRPDSAWSDLGACERSRGGGRGFLSAPFLPELKTSL